MVSNFVYTSESAQVLTPTQFSIRFLSRFYSSIRSVAGCLDVQLSPIDHLFEFRLRFLEESLSEHGLVLYDKWSPHFLSSMFSGTCSFDHYKAYIVPLLAIFSTSTVSLECCTIRNSTCTWWLYPSCGEAASPRSFTGNIAQLLPFPQFIKYLNSHIIPLSLQLWNSLNFENYTPISHSTYPLLLSSWLSNMAASSSSSSGSSRLAGKVAIVTGGGSGFGARYAHPSLHASGIFFLIVHRIHS